MDLVGTEIDDFVLLGLGVAGEHGSEFPREAFA
jgi:hypothetical protein